MARGWESKSVEDQVAAAETFGAATHKKRLTPEELERNRKVSVLQAACARIQQQLRLSGNPRYRKLLETELASLDKQIAELCNDANS